MVEVGLGQRFTEKDEITNEGALSSRDASEREAKSPGPLGKGSSSIG